MVYVRIFHTDDRLVLQLLLDTRLAVIRHCFGRGNGSDCLECIGDFERVINIPAIEVNPAGAIHPEKFLCHYFLENVVQFIVLCEPAMTANIEFEFAELGLPLDCPRKTTNERRPLNHSDRNAGLAKYICRAQPTRTSTHDQSGVV